jgi:MYXO-CTERM domain-containing protein
MNMGQRGRPHGRTARLAMGALVVAVMLLPAAAAEQGTTTPGAFDGRCSIPCGPIPVIITIKLEQTDDLAFEGKDEMVLPGTMEYRFDIDQDGYLYDPQEEPVVVFKTPRSVPWVEVSVEPPEVTIPVRDPQYIQMDDPENDPSQMSYVYTADIQVTITKTREPTAVEMEQYVRSDGMYRILLAATANSSMEDSGGYQLGLMEGYGVRQLRFIPEDGDASPQGEPNEGGSAPSPGAVAGWVGLVAAAGLVSLIRRRNR